MSRVNRNAVYLFHVDGHTPWERLRVIRHFLTERHQALATAELSLSESDAQDPDTHDWHIWQIRRPQFLEIIEDCRDEIEFLEQLESELADYVEPTRIPGKTDREMYEINHMEEFVESIAFEAKAEIAASGAITPPTMKRVLKVPMAVERLAREGLLTEGAVALSKSMGVNRILPPVRKELERKGE